MQTEKRFKNSALFGTIMHGLELWSRRVPNAVPILCIIPCQEIVQHEEGKPTYPQYMYFYSRL